MRSGSNGFADQEFSISIIMCFLQWIFPTVQWSDSRLRRGEAKTWAGDGRKGLKNFVFENWIEAKIL